MTGKDVDPVSSTGMWCEVDNCDHEAWYRVSAQWSIFDFDSAFVCYAHMNRVCIYLENRFVDGHGPVEVYTETLPITDDLLGRRLPWEQTEQ